MSPDQHLDNMFSKEERGRETEIEKEREIKIRFLTLVLMGGGPYAPPPKGFYFFTKNLSPKPLDPPVNS